MNLFTLKDEEMTIKDVQENLQGILEQIDFLYDDVKDLKLDYYDGLIIESLLDNALDDLEDVKSRLEKAENEEL
jgi:hypothetical protein